MWKKQPFEPNREREDNSYGEPSHFSERPHRDFSYGRSPHFNENRGSSRPRASQVNVSMGDAESQPQTAVGGIREVEELLTKSPAKVHRVLFRHDSGNPKLYSLQKIAKKNHIHVQQVDGHILDSYALPNQGIVALCNEKELLSWDEVKTEFFNAKENGERKLVVVATNIEDPRNLGACIRSSLGMDADIILMPSKGMCGITPTVAKASAGALDKMRLCRPDNLEATISELKLAGYQVLGLDAVTETSLVDYPFEDQVVLAVGGEDVGLPPFVRKQCTSVLRIPMSPEAQSYNASVALSLGLYEIARKRIK
ncbi:MAG: RNA methyltransferase [Fibrobacteraceae bacterium]|nr:RNA methyltransferase [Fibrobacteraceae bacterium]